MNYLLSVQALVLCSYAPLDTALLSVDPPVDSGHYRLQNISFLNLNRTDILHYVEQVLKQGANIQLVLEATAKRVIYHIEKSRNHQLIRYLIILMLFLSGFIFVMYAFVLFL